MAEIFNFYVYDNRTIQFPKNNLLEPIMQEDKDVATWRFRIPKVLNNIDMSGWAWWFVYVNAKGQEYSELLTLTDDIDEPASYSTADYDIDYGISKFPGSFSFALEAISTEQGGEISGEWHTRTYTHTVTPTLQGNQAEYAEAESDVISALMQEVRNKVNQLVGGATPLPVNLKSKMADHDKVYLYTGEETGESTGYWYYWNGTDFVPGGLYAAGIQIDNTLSQSGQAADAKATGDEIAGIKSDLTDVSDSLYKVIVLKGVSTNTSGALIPFHVKNGDTIEAYTTDESTFDNVQLRFYDADKAYINHKTLSSGYGKSRTFTADLSRECYYIGITTVTTSSPDSYTVINKSNRFYKDIHDGYNALSAVDENLQEQINLSPKMDIINRFNPATITAGKYISVINGDLGDNSSFFASDYIYIGDLDSVNVSYTHIFGWYDANKNWLGHPDSMNSINNDLTVEVPENAVYLRFSAYNTSLTLAQIGESVTRDNYVPYGKYTLPDFVPVTDQIVVDANGNGDYTSLTEALYNNVNSGVDIIVKQGTYDIVAEYVALFGQSAVDNMADADSSVFNGFQYGAIIRNRKIFFETGSHVVCDWTGHTVDGTHRFSAIRVDYNCEIFGLDLVATATFYAIHDDYGLTVPYTVKYENCRVEGVNLTNANCIGGGCKKYSRHILKNCYFNNNLTGSATVRYHNTNADGAEPEVYVSNCYFNNWFTPRWYGTQTSKMRVYVNNCEARSIHKLQESASFNVDNVELFKWCNTETSPVT